MKVNNPNQAVRLRFESLSAWLTAFLFLLFAAPVPASVPLVQNGGFETGSFSSWTQSGNTSSTYVNASGLFVRSGAYGGELGPCIARIPDADFSNGNRQSYLLSFWFGYLLQPQ